MSDFVLDLDDKEVRVGDRIAYAATDGRSGGLRTGRVLSVIPERVTTESDKYWGEGHKVPAKLKVSVEKSSGYWKPEKPTIIDATLKRFARL